MPLEFTIVLDPPPGGGYDGCIVTFAVKFLLIFR
jgi:hypothetical protein